MLECVKRAAEIVGGVSRLSQMTEIDRASMYSWRKVPVQFVKKIEVAQRRALAEEARATKTKRASMVTRYDMRPDLYPRKNGG